MTEHYEWKTELTEDGARAWKEKLVNKNKVLRIVEKLSCPYDGLVDGGCGACQRCRAIAEIRAL